MICLLKLNYLNFEIPSVFGSYVAPEYASTGMLNERSDVYSFGILIMEIISGRSPVDYARPPGEVRNASDLISHSSVCHKTWLEKLHVSVSG